MNKLIRKKSFEKCVVIDLGKTNVKAFVFDSSGKVLWETQTENKTILDADYVTLDHEYAWNWSNDTLFPSQDFED